MLFFGKQRLHYCCPSALCFIFSLHGSAADSETNDGEFWVCLPQQRRLRTAHGAGLVPFLLVEGVAAFIQGVNLHLSAFYDSIHVPGACLPLSGTLLHCNCSSGCNLCEYVISNCAIKKPVVSTLYRACPRMAWGLSLEVLFQSLATMMDQSVLYW